MRDTALAFAATLTLAAAIFLREASTRAAWAAILEFRAITLATALDTALGAADFLAAAFLAGAFLAATFFAGALLAGAFLAATFFAGALLAGAFLAATFLAGAFLAGAFFAGAFLASAFLGPAFFTVAATVGALAETVAGAVFSVLLVAGLFTGALRDLDNGESEVDMALLCVVI